jgi:hypothetical protein
VTILAPALIKSFREAYKQAAARKNRISFILGGAASNSFVDKIVKAGPKLLSEDEARLILGVPKEASN